MKYKNLIVKLTASLLVSSSLVNLSGCGADNLEQTDEDSNAYNFSFKLVDNNYILVDDRLHKGDVFVGSLVGDGYQFHFDCGQIITAPYDQTGKLYRAYVVMPEENEYEEVCDKCIN